MSALGGLVKKEFRYIRTGTIVVGSALLLYFIGLVVAAMYYSAEAVAFFVVMPLGLSIWFVPAFLMSSLGIERNTMHIWLHNPQSSWMLLGSKMIVAIGVGAVLTVLNTIGIYTLSASSLFSPALFYFSGWWDDVLFGLGSLTASCYIATWLMFGWVVFHALERFVRRISLYVTIALLAGVIVLIAGIETSDGFAHLAQWIGGSFKIPVGFEASMHTPSNTFEMTVANANVNVLHFFFHVGIACLLFFLSCRFIDRGIEV